MGRSLYEQCQNVYATTAEMCANERYGLIRKTYTRQVVHNTISAFTNAHSHSQNVPRQQSAVILCLLSVQHGFRLILNVLVLFCAGTFALSYPDNN